MYELCSQLYFITCCTMTHTCAHTHARTHARTYAHTHTHTHKVLVEWVDRDSLREWVDFSKEDKIQAVFLEQSLLWAKRVLVTEQSRAVAWPAKVSLYD